MPLYQATITHHSPSTPGTTTLRFPVVDPKDIYDHLRRPTNPSVTHTTLVVTSLPDHTVVLSDLCAHPHHQRPLPEPRYHHL